MEKLFFGAIVILFLSLLVAAIVSGLTSQPPPRKRTPEDLDQEAAWLRADARLREERARHYAASTKDEMARAELEDTRTFLKTRNDPKQRIGHA